MNAQGHARGPLRIDTDCGNPDSGGARFAGLAAIGVTEHGTGTPCPVSGSRQPRQ